MTDGGFLFLGWLCIASALMAFGAHRVLKAQRVAGERWGNSPPMQLSTAILIHGLSSIPAFAATLLAGTKEVSDPTTYLIWATWMGWLVAKTLVIRVTGYTRLAFGLYGLWLVVWLIGRVL